MEELFKLAEKIVFSARDNGVMISLAESCTGGLVATALTSVSGSSDVFDRGYVTYSNESKNELLGVSKNTIQEYGSVSSQCVEEMVLGAAKNSLGDITISITGIAGSNLHSPSKPVGLVYFGCFDKKQNKLHIEEKQFSGDRNSIRIEAAIQALEYIAQMIEDRKNMKYENKNF